MHQSSLRYFNPALVFVIGFLFFVVLPIVYYQESDYNIIVLSCIMLLSYLLGHFFVILSRLNSSSRKVKLRFRYSKTFLNLCCYFFIFISLLKLLVYFIYGVETGSYSDKYSGRSALELYLQLFDKLTFVFSLVFLSLLSSKGRHWYYFISITSIFISFLDGTRLVLVFSLVYWAMLGVAFNYVKVSFLKFSAAIVIAPFLFSFLLLKRVYHFEGSPFKLAAFLYEKLDLSIIVDSMEVGLETFQSYLTFKQVIADQLIEPASGYIRLLFMPIPRGVWLDKPESLSRLIANEYFPGAYASGGGQIAGPLGDAYINGGFVAIIIVWFVLGFTLSYMFRKFKVMVILGTDEAKVYYTVLYFIFFSYFIYSLRGFGSDFFWVFLFNIIVLWFCEKIFFVKD